MCASSASWAVPCAEQQCGWQCAGECRGCHNRKHGDITCPSGGTEADGAGMRLHDPRGIWPGRQGVLSSFLRQREEESGAGLAVCVLSDRTKRHQQTLWFGERWIPAHFPAPALCPKVQRERVKVSTDVGEGATCQGLPGSQRMPEGQVNSVCKLRGPSMCSFFNVIRSFPLKEFQVFNWKNTTFSKIKLSVEGEKNKFQCQLMLTVPCQRFQLWGILHQKYFRFSNSIMNIENME